MRGDQCHGGGGCAEIGYERSQAALATALKERDEARAELEIAWADCSGPQACRACAKCYDAEKARADFNLKEMLAVTDFLIAEKARADAAEKELEGLTLALESYQTNKGPRAHAQLIADAKAWTSQTPAERFAAMANYARLRADEDKTKSACQVAEVFDAAEARERVLREALEKLVEVFSGVSHEGDDGCGWSLDNDDTEGEHEDYPSMRACGTCLEWRTALVAAIAALTQPAAPQAGDIPLRITEPRSQWLAAGATPQAAGPSAPLGVLLFCPSCKEQHVDAPEPGSDWTNPPHRSHKCHSCGVIWRASDEPTNGIAAPSTRGKADTWDVFDTVGPSAPTIPKEVAHGLVTATAPGAAEHPAAAPAPSGYGIACGEAIIGRVDLHGGHGNPSVQLDRVDAELAHLSHGQLVFVCTVAAAPAATGVGTMTITPGVCAGSGWPAIVPPSSTAIPANATCGICGEWVPITPDGRCETHGAHNSIRVAAAPPAAKPEGGG